MAEKHKILEIKDLQVHYAVRTGTIKGVDHVDLSVDEGETLGLVGESACGTAQTSSTRIGKTAFRHTEFYTSMVIPATSTTPMPRWLDGLSIMD